MLDKSNQINKTNNARLIIVCDCALYARPYRRSRHFFIVFSDDDNFNDDDDDDTTVLCL